MLTLIVLTALKVDLEFSLRVGAFPAGFTDLTMDQGLKLTLCF